MARSFLNTLSTVVQSGIAVLVWAGDAGRLGSMMETALLSPEPETNLHLDWICNWNSNYDVVHAIEYNKAAEFASAKLRNYTVDGKVYGEYKTAGNLSWLKVFGAGHEVTFYRECHG